MSKNDALRAMREARYAAAQTSAPAAPVRQPSPAATKPAAKAAAAAVPVSDELCGHKNMSGRTCTRERGHTAKSHRYS